MGGGGREEKLVCEEEASESERKQHEVKLGRGDQRGRRDEREF